MITNEVRSYEVSLWTLQDDFITVLKWSDVEQQGRIQQPKMTIDIDGTQNFSFVVPMYLNVRTEASFGATIAQEENPIWYTIKDEKLLIGMRKIKVIFNKMTDDEQVFDFLITKVTEEHTDNTLMCKVECEGLAFHELGKVGYKYNLDIEDFQQEYEKWIDSGCVGEEPKSNVDFWCEKIGLVKYSSEEIHNPKVWYYDVQMDWASFYTRAPAETNPRSADKVYEEEFVTSWDQYLNPLSVDRACEKQRIIQVSESNIYNITQTIAEQFGIHCKYVYKYDTNYHIIERIIVFYNNFFKEKDGIMGINYPYSSTSITRELDSTDLTTKLFVKAIDDDNVYDGIISIMNSPANMTKEDYLLNFDYLYSIGAITDEQYEEIDIFNQKVRASNEELESIATKLNTYEQKKIELEAKVTTYENSLALDEEQINYNRKLQVAMDNLDGTQDGIITRTASNPDQFFVREKESGGYYIDLSTVEKGILPSTLELYKTYVPGNHTLTDKIDGYNIELDEYGNACKINNVPTTEQGIIYAIYQYDPELYYKNIEQIWKIKQFNDSQALASAEMHLALANEQIEALELSQETELSKKEEYLQEFQHMMGAALREGYWSPENYQDYGEKHSVTHSLSDATVDMVADSGDSAIIGWDNILFDDEQKLTYQLGVNLEEHYYPCIDLTQAYQSGTIFDVIKNEPEKYSFMYSIRTYESTFPGHEQDIEYMKIFAIGSQALVRFIKYNNTIKPVLVLIGASTIDDDEIAAMKTAGRYPIIGKMSTSYNENNNTVSTIIDNKMSINTSSFLADATLNNCEIVYPRIKISNLLFKTAPDELAIIYNNTVLERYVNYNVLTRFTERDNIQYPEYFINLKIDTFLSLGYTGDVTTLYTISNAGTAIYLDAKEVLQENSQPKVSYTIKANVVDLDRIRIAYSLLSQLVMINDPELKFHDTFGYISNLNLDLDQPQNDEYEIKNYKTKFEDLFASIVAETEEMKKSGDAIASAATGSIVLNNSGFQNTLEQNTSALTSFLDNYIASSAPLQEMLESLFSEAGSIISQADQLQNTVQALSTKNAAILSGLSNEISTNLQPHVYRQAAQPAAFKNGDIWIEIDPLTGETVNTYVATSDSKSSVPGSGFVKTDSGSLAQIKGTALNIDAAEGNISILAPNNIDIGAGKTVSIAANENINIHGNKAVNIGGTQINIGTTNIGNSTITGGINLIATGYTTNNFASTLSTSRVLINPSRIEMAGSIINLLTSDNSGAVSAIRLDGANGIYIGSGKSITLYSGTATAATPFSASNIEINPSHILLGVSATGSSTFVEMNSNKIYMGAASNKTSLDSNAPSTSLAGVQISPSGIIMAAGNNSNNSLVSILPTAITLGTVGSNNSGSFVQLAQSGIVIGSSSKIEISTTNFKIKSDATTTTPMLYIANNGTWESASSGIQYTQDGGLEIKSTSLNIMINGTSTPISNYVNNAISNAQISVTDERIWQGVTAYANGGTNTGGLLIESGRVKLSANDTYVDINTNGITMQGQHIYINGEQEWSRDDIIVMNPNATGTSIWRKTEAAIQAYMTNGSVRVDTDGNVVSSGGTLCTRSDGAATKDWVLIKPYYNAAVIATSESGKTYSGSVRNYDQISNATWINLNSNGNDSSLGDGGAYYIYEVSVRVIPPSTTSGGGIDVSSGIAYITNTSGNSTIQVPISGSILHSSAKWWTGSFRSEGTGKINLCTEGQSLKIRFGTGASSADIEVENITVTVSTNATTSRVPCTVYYFPQTSS